MNQLDYSDFNQDIFSQDNLPEYTVGGLKEKITEIVGEHFPTEIWLIGEIVKKAPGNVSSGSPYLRLELADEKSADSKNKSVLPVLIWPQYLPFIEKKFSNATNGEEIKEGIKVRFKGSLKYNATYGLQLQASDIDPTVTLGDIAKRRRIIIEQLKKDRIFEQNKNLSPPFDFFRVVVISPSKASGLKDFTNTANDLENSGLCHFDYLESSFEGSNVEKSISMNLSKAAEIHAKDPIDAVVIIRGGGARRGLIDLMNEKLARLICEFPVPVITGIGHGDDKGFVMDEVSNINQDTPSKVVAHIESRIRENTENVRINIERINEKADSIMTHANSSLNNLSERMRDTPLKILSFERQKISNYSEQISYGLKGQLKRTFDALQHLVDSLRYESSLKVARQDSFLKNQVELLSDRSRMHVEKSTTLLREYQKIIEQFGPEALLKRGLVIARSKDKKIVKTKKKAKINNRLTLTFQDGDVDVTI